jgi:AcrR family transcriptional regulator
MATQTTTVVRRRLPRDERRAQLLTAAAAAFVRGGYDGTSMEDVAEAAGVTRLIVYRVYASKEDLYRSVLASVTDRLRSEFAGPEGPYGADELGSRGGVAALLLGIARAHPDAFRLLWRHAAHEPLFAAEATAFREIAFGVADELIRPYLRDPVFRRWGAASVVGYLYDGICAWLDRGDPSRDDEFVDRLAAGVRALLTTWAE